MALSFSTNDQAAIAKTVKTHIETSIQDLHKCFEVKRCVEWIQQHEYKNVALQFPDSLMTYSPRVSQQIEDGLGQK